MLDSNRSEPIDTTEFSCTFDEVVLGESSGTLSLSDLQHQSSPTRCKTRYPRGHKRVRQYNMSVNNGSFQSLSLSATSYGSIRSPTGRFPSTVDCKSPRRLLRSTTPKTRMQMIESMKQALNERSLNDSIKIGKEDRIGSEKLKHIHEHRLGIAEMRPKERKIKFCHSKKTPPKSRIDGLKVDDLSIHLMRVCLSEGEKSESEKRKDEIARLEAGIKKCLSEIDRAKKETIKDIEQAAKLRSENQTLRSEIARIPLPHKQSIKQAQRHLESSIRCLKNEVNTINNQIHVLLHEQKQLIATEVQERIGSMSMKTIASESILFRRKRTISPERFARDNTD